MDIKEAVKNAALELCEKAKLTAGQSVVVGCSTSETAGHQIGTHSKADIGMIIFTELSTVFTEHGVNIVAQCCEHLNRALIVERAISCGCTIVNAVPDPDAGGAFAAAAYKSFSDPVAVESFRADAGLDIGDTFIGMHLKHVAVPIRLSIKKIGEANLTAARTRPPLIGGNRTMYDKNLM